MGLKVKKIPFLESERMVDWKELNVEKLKCEYNVLRRLLYANKNVYPDELSLRLTFVVLEMEKRANIYAMCTLLLRKLLSLFSGVIDVERCNGTKKWMVPPKRDRLKTDKLNKILRIYYNSPDLGDSALNSWIINVAKMWNRKNRNHTCDELNAICNEDNDS